MTTLGWLKFLRDPRFPYWEYLYLKWIHVTLTRDWYILQWGVDEQALEKWLMVMRFLELDRKARVDLMLLAHSGLVGRAWANKILWDLLAIWALDPVYEDLSHKVSSEVGWVRRRFDRPPGGHRDLQWWNWTYYEELGHMQRWSPQARPSGPWDLAMGPGEEPWQPPWCFGPPHQ